MNLEQVARRAKVPPPPSRECSTMPASSRAARAPAFVKVIEELNYHPNLHARHLAGGKSRTIGVIVSNLENPFFFDIYKAVEAGAHARGFEVVMANTDYRSGQLVSSVRLNDRAARGGPGRHRVGDGAGAHRRTHRQRHSGGLLRRWRAAAEHHEHPRQLPPRHREGDRLPARPGPPAPGFRGTPRPAGADQ